MTSPTKAERDARSFWCEEHDRWFTGREGCREARVDRAECETCGGAGLSGSGHKAWCGRGPNILAEAVAA